MEFLVIKNDMKIKLVLFCLLMSQFVYSMQHKQPSDQLFKGVENNDIELVKRVIRQKADVNSLKTGEKPLHVACFMDHSDIILVLLKAKADPNISDAHLNIPLSRAINRTYTDTENVIENFLRFGANPNFQDRYGRTPLHFAFYNNIHLTVILKLLNNGADFMIEDYLGKNPLSVAKKNLSRVSFKRLLQEYKELITEQVNKHLHNVLTLIVFDYICME